MCAVRKSTSICDYFELLKSDSTVQLSHGHKFVQKILLCQLMSYSILVFLLLGIGWTVSSFKVCENRQKPAQVSWSPDGAERYIINGNGTFRGEDLTIIKAGKLSCWPSGTWSWTIIYHALRVCIKGYRYKYKPRSRISKAGRSSFLFLCHVNCAAAGDVRIHISVYQNLTVLVNLVYM